MWDMLAAADRIGHARVHVLPGSHFLPLEYPEEIGGFLRELAARTELGQAYATSNGRPGRRGANRGRRKPHRPRPA